MASWLRAAKIRSVFMSDPYCTWVAARYSLPMTDRGSTRVALQRWEQAARQRHESCQADAGNEGWGIGRLDARKDGLDRDSGGISERQSQRRRRLRTAQRLPSEPSRRCFGTPLPSRSVRRFPGRGWRPQRRASHECRHPPEGMRAERSRLVRVLRRHVVRYRSERYQRGSVRRIWAAQDPLRLRCLEWPA